MGVLYAARDLRCANNQVLIKAVRYDGGTNARHFAYTADEAVKHVERLRAILEWEKKILIRVKKEGINNVPSINDFFYDTPVLLNKSYEGKRGTYEIPDELWGQEPYIVMERIRGTTLEDALHAYSQPQKRDLFLLKLAKEILTILIRLHRKFDVAGNKAYFIYQDLKPANVLVSPGEYFTLIDFGGVTLRLGEKTTEPTAGMLTYGYAAPEAEHEGGVLIDQRFDIYSLGASLYHCLTGIDPRELPGEFPKLDLTPLRRSGAAAPVVQLIERALERDPDARYGIAAEMRKDVVNALRTLGHYA